MDLLTKFLSGKLLVYFYGATEEQLDAFESITGTCWSLEAHIKDRMDYAHDRFYHYLVYNSGLLRTISDEREAISIESFIQEYSVNNIEENDVMEIFS